MCYFEKCPSKLTIMLHPVILDDNLKICGRDYKCLIK